MKKYALLMMLAALCACGVKPGDVDPPEGAKASDFPRTYPNPVIYRPPPLSPVR
jgi:hypothetical protein